VQEYHSTNLHQQLEKATTMDDVMNVAEAELSIDREKMYTDALACDAPAIRLNPLLTDKEAEDARWWYKYLDHEVILLHGPIRSGKGTIGDKVLKLANWYYNKTVLLDYRPRELFDLQYVPTYYDKEYNNPHDPVLVKHTKYVRFDKKVFIDQIARMGDVSLGELANDAAPDIAKINKAKADEVASLRGRWMAQTGRVWLQDAILGLDEIKQYHPLRNQLNPFGILLIYLYDLLGHMHLCILGMTAYYNELDPNQFLPKVTVEIKVHKSELNPYAHFGEVYRSHWVNSKGDRELKRVRSYVVDGREPWPLLGNYAYSELAQDIGMGELDMQTGIRSSEYIVLKSTRDFRRINGVAWLENEYIGYALASDDEGWTYVIDEMQGMVRGENYGVPNALIGVQRRLNYRINRCEPAAHKKGVVIYSGLGVYDIFDSENARGVPVAKSLLKN
jgi:hypothetical protein